MLSLVSEINAQTIWSIPEFPLASESVEIFFDASECSCALSSYSGELYAHSGIIIDGISSWQNVIGNWGENITQPKLDYIGNSTYKLLIPNSIREFYGASQSDIITKIAIVFRSSDATQQSSDLFLDVFREGKLLVISPSSDQIFSIGDSLDIRAVALGADSLSARLDGEKLNSESGGNLNFKYELIEEGSKDLLITAYVNGQEDSQLTQVFVRSANSVVAIDPSWKDGVNRIDNSSMVSLVLTAPESDFVFVVGDFNNWEISQDYQLNQSPGGDKFWIEIANLNSTEEYAYQYVIDGVNRLADPHTSKVLDPWNDAFIPESIYPNLKAYPEVGADGIVSVFSPSAQEFNWSHDDYERVEQADLVIYELLIRDFVADHSYQSVIDSLDYLQSIGINTIELMPVMEFEGNSSWGYNTSFHKALDKYYGTEEDFKQFVDACHERGIAVLLDFVINHAYGQNSKVRMYWDNEFNRPAENNPWFNTVSPNPVFSFGFDYDHESDYTVEYFNDVLDYWMAEFHVDGYRLDFTKGLTNKPGDGGSYDASRISILNNYAGALWEKHPEAVIILEHFAPNSEERELSEEGMMLWGNHNHNFNQIAMGYVSGSDFSGSSYLNRGFSEPNLVAYMESHDEERMLFKTSEFGNSTGNYNVKNITIGLERAKLASLLYFSVPGPKLIWMFGELGYDVSIDDPCRVCEKPIRWNYLKDTERKALKTHYSEILALREAHSVFQTTNFDVDANGYVKLVRLYGQDNNVLVVGNIDVSSRTEQIDFEIEGEWYEYFSGDRVIVAETGMTAINLDPGEYRLYSTTAFREVEPEPSEWSAAYLEELNIVKIESNEPLNKVVVFDASGRAIIAQETNNNRLELSAIDWPIGVYIISIEGHNRHKKIIKRIP